MKLVYSELDTFDMTLVILFVRVKLVSFPLGRLLFRLARFRAGEGDLTRSSHFGPDRIGHTGQRGLAG